MEMTVESSGGKGGSPEGDEREKGGLTEKQMTIIYRCV